MIYKYIERQIESGPLESTRTCMITGMHKV